MATARPNFLQYIAYSYGFRRLPDSMRSWVARDLAGKGAVRRFMFLAAIPPFLILAPFWCQRRPKIDPFSTVEN